MLATNSEVRKNRSYEKQIEKEMRAVREENRELLAQEKSLVF